MPIIAIKWWDSNWIIPHKFSVTSLPKQFKTNAGLIQDILLPGQRPRWYWRHLKLTSILMMLNNLNYFKGRLNEWKLGCDTEFCTTSHQRSTNGSIHSTSVILTFVSPKWHNDFLHKFPVWNSNIGMCVLMFTAQRIGFKSSCFPGGVAKSCNVFELWFSS